MNMGYMPKFGDGLGVYLCEPKNNNMCGYQLG